MREYCEDTTRLMLCKGDGDSSTRINLDEQIDAHNFNIRMKGATDALRGLRVIIHEVLSNPLAPAGVALIGLGKMLDESVADTAEYLWSACPTDEDDE